MGDADAIAAWQDFHAYATQATTAIENNCGSGLTVDFHGHSHPEGKITSAC